MNRTSSTRRGFTLPELLVAIGIIGLLCALLMPAIQRVRDRANQITCKNNMRQLGLALHGYDSVHGFLPPGMTTKPNPAGHYPYLSWIARVLPHLEQDGLWATMRAAYRENQSPFAVPPHTPFAQPLKVLSCPSDGRCDAVQVSAQHGWRVALTDYIGVAGTNFVKKDGLFFRDSRVSLATITDGLSNTLAVGERPPPQNFVYGWWYAGAGQGATGSVDFLMGVAEISLSGYPFLPCDGGPYRYGPGDPFVDCDAMHYWSFHPGGGHFALADGSVRWIAYTAEPHMTALATRASGDIVRPWE